MSNVRYQHFCKLGKKLRKRGVFTALLVGCVAVLLISGCGQKGPLKLPEKPNQERTPSN